MNGIRRFLRDESGQSLTEYALIIALVAIALIATITAFKDKLLAVFKTIGDSISGVSGS